MALSKGFSALVLRYEKGICSGNPLHSRLRAVYLAYLETVLKAHAPSPGNNKTVQTRARDSSFTYCSLQNS